MDGVHDLGGMQGFGPVEIETDEPVFHADWERHAYRLTISSLLAGHLSGGFGGFRHAIERMEPAWYLVSPYYEHWLTGTATCMVEAGVITQQELDDRLGEAFAVSVWPACVTGSAGPGASSDRPTGTASATRFAFGKWHLFGHTRAPRYVQGKRGTVVRLDGAYSLPDVEGRKATVRRKEPTYSVRFEAIELWGPTPATRFTSTFGRATSRPPPSGG